MANSDVDLLEVPARTKTKEEEIREFLIENGEDPRDFDVAALAEDDF